MQARSAGNDFDAGEGVTRRGHAVLRDGRIFAALLLLVIAPTNAHAQISERIDVTAVEVIAIVERGDPSALRPEDLLVREEGREVRVTSVEQMQLDATRTGESVETASDENLARVVIWLDPVALSKRTLSEYSDALAAGADELTKFGNVEVVSGTVPATTLIEPTRNPRVLREFFANLPRYSASNELLTHRIDVYRMLEAFGSASHDTSGGQLQLPSDDRHRLEALRIAMREEDGILRRSARSMLSWLGAQSSRPPVRALFWLGDGFAIAPAEFYGDLASNLTIRVGKQTKPGDAMMSGDLTEASRSAGLLHQALSDTLAASGWLVFPVSSEPAHSTFDVSYARMPHLEGGTLTSGLGASLNALAHATGGRRVPNPSQVSSAVGDLQRTVRIVYQVSRPVDARVRSLEVSSRSPEFTIRGAKVVAGFSTTALAVERAETLDTTGRGDLPVHATLTLSEEKRGQYGGTIDLTFDLSPLAPALAHLAATNVRLLVLASTPEGPVTLETVVSASTGSSMKRWSSALVIPSSTTRVSAIVEEEWSGAWGGANIPIEAPLAVPWSATAGANEARTTTLLRDDLWRITWHSAFQEARDRHRLLAVLVTDRSCPNCRAVVPEVAANQQLRETLEQHYIPVWVDLDNPPPEIEQSEPFWDRPPELYVMDPWGGVIAKRRFDDIGALLAMLEGAARGSGNLVAGARHVRTDERDYRGQALIALGYAEMGDAARARAQWSLARDAADEAGDSAFSFDTSLDIAMTHAWERRFDRALDSLEPLEETAADDDARARIWFTRGRIHTLAGQPHEATEAFLLASRLASAGTAIRQKSSELAARGIGGIIDSAPRSNVAAPLRIILPPHRPLTGRTQIQAMPLRPDVASVEFRLKDESRVDDRAPFAAKLDLGDTRSQVLTVIARNFDGDEIGRDSLLINPSSESRLVRIASEPRGSGSFVVELEAVSPPGDRIDAIDIYWNDRLVRTIAGSDRTPSLDLPEDTGVLRVVARYASGEDVEDARLWNAVGEVQHIDVSRIQTFARAEDRRGRTMTGLSEDDFRLIVNGKVHPIENVVWDPAAATSVGLVIDVSDSMREQLPEVLTIARSFLDAVLSRGGEAFTVAFSDQPYLIAPRTRSRDRLVASITELEVAGGTALWDAIAFGMLQFQETSGKRALLVLSDGSDTSSRSDWREATRISQEIGVPVFVISIRQGLDAAFNPITQSERNARADVERLTERSGGEAFWLSGLSTLDRVLNDVLQLTNEQYTIVWQPPPGLPRHVDIEVRSTREGVRVRSASALILEDE